MQPPDLQALLAKWVGLFRLQDRIITAEYARNLVNPVTGDVVYGLLTIQNPAEGRFKIEIQDLSTWPADATRPPTLRTIENAIRHECAHIRVHDFAPQNPTDADILAEERAVWAISDAFDAIADGEYPRVAAMVVQSMARKSQTLSQVAANVRAMIVKPAATRQQHKGKSMDALAISAALAVIMAASPEDQPKLLAELKNQIDAAVGKAPASEPEPGAPPAGQDAGNGAPDKDKMAPDQMRAMSADVASIRAMKAEVTKLRDEAKAAADMLRPDAKQALIRGMVADGVKVTPHAEKIIVEAPTLEAAQQLATGMRAMAGAPAKPPAKPPADEGGLTPAQATRYRGMVAQNSSRAEAYRDECIRLNSKKGGAK